MKYPFWDLISLKGQQSFVGELRKEKKNKSNKNNCNKINEKILNNIDFKVNEIIGLFSLQNAVQAITLGGSRVTERADDKSDYDLYIYLKKDLDNNIRRNILSSFCQYIEIGNSYWETEDNCILNNGIHIDIIYRNTNNFVQNIIDVCENGKSHNGYTTCLWHNLVTSEIVYDKNNYFTSLKNRFSKSYPKYLKDSIIKRNMNLLTNSIVSYDKQIRKSVSRQDLVNINNRISVFLESYFDVIFALNEIKNPGEKYIMEICREKCKILPIRFEDNIKSLFYCLSNDINKINDIIEKMICDLKQVLNSSKVV